MDSHSMKDAEFRMNESFATLSLFIQDLQTMKLRETADYIIDKCETKARKPWLFRTYKYHRIYLAMNVNRSNSKGDHRFKKSSGKCLIEFRTKG